MRRCDKISSEQLAQPHRLSRLSENLRSAGSADLSIGQSIVSVCFVSVQSHLLIDLISTLVCSWLVAEVYLVHCTRDCPSSFTDIRARTQFRSPLIPIFRLLESNRYIFRIDSELLPR